MHGMWLLLLQLFGWAEQLCCQQQMVLPWEIARVQALVKVLVKAEVMVLPWGMARVMALVKVMV